MEENQNLISDEDDSVIRNITLSLITSVQIEIFNEQNLTEKKFIPVNKNAIHKEHKPNINKFLQEFVLKREER